LFDRRIEAILVLQSFCQTSTKRMKYCRVIASVKKIQKWTRDTQHRSKIRNFTYKIESSILLAMEKKAAFEVESLRKDGRAQVLSRYLQNRPPEEILNMNDSHSYTPSCLPLDTTIIILQSHFRRQMERKKLQLRQIAAIIIQKQFRRHVDENNFYHIKQNIIMLQTLTRECLARTSKRVKALILIQAWVRSIEKRHLLTRCFRSILVLQSFSRTSIQLLRYRRVHLLTRRIQKWVRRKQHQAKAESSVILSMERYGYNQIEKILKGESVEHFSACNYRLVNRLKLLTHASKTLESKNKRRRLKGNRRIRKESS